MFFCITRVGGGARFSKPGILPQQSITRVGGGGHLILPVNLNLLGFRCQIGGLRQCFRRGSFLTHPVLLLFNSPQLPGDTVQVPWGTKKPNRNS